MKKRYMIGLIDIDRYEWQVFSFATTPAVEAMQKYLFIAGPYKSMDAAIAASEDALVFTIAQEAQDD